MLYRAVTLGIVASTLGTVYPVRSQESCSLLSVVGGKGSAVTKTVAQPTIPGIFGIDITRNNWNTDWAIPGNARFYTYITTITSNDEGPFEIRMYLKYSDQTADEFYGQKSIKLQPGKPLVIKAQPRPDDQPYQANLFVGGVDGLGQTYTASVVGCR